MAERASPVQAHDLDTSDSALLIVDDEANVLYALEKALRNEPFKIRTATTAREALTAFDDCHPDLILCDIQLPDMSGLDLFQRFRARDAHIPVVMMTAHGTAETAIEAMKLGAFDYLLKPYDLPALRETLKKAVATSRLSRVPVVFADGPNEAANADRMIGRSAAMQQVYKDIGRVAPQDVNVLILGETGTGKELVARAIYRHSRRQAAPFLAMNCAALPDALLESELFGHEKGAFTGADRQRIGKFEQADRGTLFLDEIGDMSLTTQAKLLRVLQDGTFERVGGNVTMRADVRVLAATNLDLESLIEDERFRRDLFYRLNTFTIRLPPLRERLDDLPLLVEHFVSQYSERLGKPVGRVAVDAMQQLQVNSWPGNVRELQNAIKYGIVRCSSDTLTAGDLPRHSAGPQLDSALETESWEAIRAEIRKALAESPGTVSEQAHRLLDQLLIDEALRAAQGSQVKAAELLGISRTTLRNRLQLLAVNGRTSTQ